MFCLSLLVACALPSGKAGSEKLDGNTDGIVVNGNAVSTHAKGDNAGDTAETTGLGQSGSIQGHNQWQAADLLAKHVIYFNYDSNALLPHGLTPLNMQQTDGSAASMTPKQVLNAYANYLLKHANSKLRIEGNTDARGSHEYNIALGERRAKAVADYLQQAGVPVKQLVIISYGKEKPLVLGQTEDAYCQNRRAKLILQGS